MNSRRVACLGLIGVFCLGLLVPSAASADTGGYPDWNVACIHTGKTSGTCANYDWGNGWSPRGYGYRNCTDWVAWRLQSFGVPDSKTRGLGNARDWPGGAQARGISVNGSPQIGDAAVRVSGTYGHVAFVEAVNGTQITVSEYNNAGTGVYGVRVGTASQLNFQKFIHFGATPSVATPPPPPPARILIRQGNSLLAKDGIGDTWTKLVDGSTFSYAVAGNRIAFLDGSHGLNIKEGLGGPWVKVADNVDDFRITDSRIVIRQDGTLLAKDGIGDTWTTLTNGSTSNYAAAGNRIAFVDSSGGLNVKEGLGGSWVKVANQVDDFRLTDSRIVVRQGAELSAKDGIGDTWTKLTDGSTSQFSVAGNRIAFKDGSGGLNVKEGIGGPWVKVANQIDDFRITGSRIIVRQSDVLSVKDGLGDMWTTLTNGSTPNYSISGNRIAFLDGSGGLNVKEGIGGTWVKVADGVNDFGLGDREAPFGAVDSAGNQLKIGGKGAGVRVSCHTQPGNDCHFRISANAKAFFGHKHSRLIKLPNRAVRVSSGETVKATIKLPKSIREIRKKAIRIVVEVRVQIVGESQTSELRMVLAGGKRNH